MGYKQEAYHKFSARRVLAGVHADKAAQPFEFAFRNGFSLKFITG
jgi:hypothetical protein